MAIAIYFRLPSDRELDDFLKFMVETSFLMISRKPEHKFVIITEGISPDKIPVFSNIETLITKAVSDNVLLKRIWLNVRLPVLLKKVKADIFFSFHNACSSTISIPQIITVRDLEKTKKTDIKKARLLLATDNLIRRTLIEKYRIPEEKIIVIYPSANKLFEPISEEKKKYIKDKYSDGKEFFLFNGIFSKRQDVITLLKSFSHFKKRQQSNFNLLLTHPVNSLFEDSLAAYKYRNDVKFIDTNDIREKASITASAYSVVLPFNKSGNITAALNTMRSGVPVIAVKSSVVSEVAGDAALFADTEGTKDIGEKMIQIYKDEQYRFKLIEKGKNVSATYTEENAALLLWESILKVLE